MPVLLVAEGFDGVEAGGATGGQRPAIGRLRKADSSLAKRGEAGSVP